MGRFKNYTTLSRFFGSTNMVLVILPKIIINSNDFYVIIQMGLCIFFMVLWAREYDSGDILVI